MVNQQKKNQIFIIMALGSLLAAYGVYRWDHQRYRGFAAGTELYPNFDIEKVAKISLEEGEEQVELTLRNEGFFFADGHPASSQKVAEVLYEVGSLTLANLISRKPEVFKELKVDAEDFKQKIVFFDPQGKIIATTLIGEMRGSAPVVRSLSQEVAYEAQKNLDLTIKKSSFFKSQLFSMKAEELTKVVYRQGGQVLSEFFLAPSTPSEENKEEASTEALFNLKKGEVIKAASEEEAQKYKKLVKDIYFEEYAAANEEKFAAANFDHVVEITLKDGATRTLYLAKIGGDYYAKVSFGANLPQRIAISPNDSPEKLKKAEAQLLLKDKVEAFKEHSGWVYKLSSYTAEDYFKLP